VLAVLAETARKCAEDATVRDTLDRLSMGQSYADADTFRAQMKRDNEQFKQLVNQLGIKG